MCGIYASISTQGSRQPSAVAKQSLCSRGPDHIGEVNSQISMLNGRTYWVSLTSTVLALRGGHVTAQPFKDALNGSCLCWNGEAWKIGPDTVTGNDGQAVFDALMKASSAQVTSKSSDDVLRVLRSIAGPFAFIFLDLINNQIYFGRDRLGRRSLLFKSDGVTTSLEFSSVADPTSGPWSEIEADAIYQLSLDENSTHPPHEFKSDLFLKSFAPIHMHKWNVVPLDLSPISLGTFNMTAPDGKFEFNLESESVLQLNSHLSESLKLRILNIPLPPGYQSEHQVRVAILFSGGLDCTVLARMAHDILPSDQYIDLLNVAFENPRVVQAAKNAAHQKKRIVEDTELPLVPCSEVFNDQIDVSPYENCPDRETGRKAFQELQRVCPSRAWRFVAIDIPYVETMTHRGRVIDLIHPHNTEMDLSIAYALYFAARGSGQATTNLGHTPVPYTTRARVLLSGLGADELFGGYTRHATAFNRNGYPGLLAELKLDVDRLGKRNLGRDDRVISHWGREARFPYLDEALVKWAVECPIWEKCGFQLGDEQEEQTPNIESGKKILRLLAYRLGMHSVAMEKKRAIQFGARTAKMEVGRTKGTNLIS